MLTERSAVIALVYAQAGVRAVAPAFVTPTSVGAGSAIGRAGFDHVQSVSPNQIKPLKCNKHVDLVLS